MTDWESKYDMWKLSNNEDSRKRQRIGLGGRYGTVEYVYVVGKIGKCPCCEEDILEDEMFTEEDNVSYHFSCYNFKKAQDEKEEE